MELIDIVMKLTGPISPAGDSRIDEERLKNLDELCTLTDKLLYQIHQIAQLHDSPLASVKKMGQVAKLFLNDLDNVD